MGCNRRRQSRRDSLASQNARLAWRRGDGDAEKLSLPAKLQKASSSLAGQAEIAGRERTMTTPEQFPITCAVFLKYGGPEIGEVTGHDRGKVIVRWPRWGRSGRYHPQSLELVEQNHERENERTR